MKNYPYTIGEMTAALHKAVGLTANQITKCITEHLWLRDALEHTTYCPSCEQLAECEANDWRALTPVEQGTAWIGYYQNLR